MIQPPRSPSPAPESFSLLWLIALLVLSFVLRPAPGAPVVAPTIALAGARLVPLSADQAASASRLLGRVAADAIAELERWQ